MNNQSERTVLITGGSSGIGLEMAKQMMAEKSTVIICGRSLDKLNAARAKVPGLNAVQCDITKAEDRRRLWNRIEKEFPGLNMLMNNAGITKRFIFEKANEIEKDLIEEWQTNYFAPVLLSKLFLPLLIKNGGTLVNVSSGLAYVPLSVEPNYCATKAALHSMSQSMRMRFSKYAVKVVEIFYPAVDTPFQGGHAPANALKSGQAAEIALRGLNRGKTEIHVKMAAMIHILGRLMPHKAIELLNSFISKNVEDILSQQEAAQFIGRP